MRCSGKRQGCLCHKTDSYVARRRWARTEGVGRPAGALACGTGVQQAQAALAWGARLGAQGVRQARRGRARVKGGSVRGARGAHRRSRLARRRALGRAPDARARGAAGWARLCTPGY